MAGEVSPTSSRNSVPRWAASNSPFLVWWASVKAPLTWPKSSLSSSDSESAPQLTDTKGASLRGERVWMALATSSLPVPLSPVTSTVELVGATALISSNMAVMAGETPRMRSSPWRLRNSALRRRFSSSRRSFSSAPRTTMRSSSTSKGLVR